MRLTRTRKQAIIEGYFDAVGTQIFVASEFIDWLSEKPEHEAYPWFFGQSDEVEARNSRIAMARSFVSGLRITVKSDAPTEGGKTVKVVEKTYPAFISPIEGRRGGGGHIRFVPEDPKSVESLRAEGAANLVSWLERFGDVFDESELSGIKRISDMQSAIRVVAA